MNIDREVQQPQGSAMQRVKFCLDMIEEADGFVRGISWQKDIVLNCTLEELVGALVSAEQELKKTVR